MVKSLLSLLSTRQSSILSGAAILMMTVFASKFLGLIKFRLLVDNFNASQSAIFLAAFKLPDFIFQLLIFGSLSVAFIPIFTEYLHKEGEEEAFKFASNILNVSLLGFFLLGLVIFIFVGPFNSLVVPGFTGQQKEMTDLLTRIILVAQMVLIIGSFFIGISQSFQRFIIPALAPVFYNLGIIFGIVVLSHPFGIMGPAFGVVCGAILHVLIQFPLVRSLGFRYHLTFDFFNRGVTQIFHLVSMRSIGIAAEQINEIVGVALASLVSSSSVTLLTFAQSLEVTPIGLFGATIAQAALPVLSREQARGEPESFKVTLLTTIHQILFLTLPAAAILIVLRIPVVRLTFGASQFSWEDTVLTGRTLAFFSLGLAAQAVYMLVVRAFYALKDTRTPVIVSIVSVLVNIGCSFLFIRVLGLEVWSLGLSYSIASNLSLMMLMIFLYHKLGGFSIDDLTYPALKMILAALVSAIALYIPIKALDQLVFDTTKTINLLLLTGIASLFGLAIYGLLVWLLKVKELTTYVNLISHISQRVRGLGKVQEGLITKEIIDETDRV